MNRLTKNGMWLVALSVFSLSSLCNELEWLWSVEQKFSMPESAAYDAKRQVIYVSNVNHYAKDSNGFISRVSSNGKTYQIEWLKGLHSPTGLTIHGDKLYVVDFDALVVIDLTSEKIVLRAPAFDASETPVLNDVAVSSTGVVYVSGSRSRTIYKLVEDRLDVWFKDDILLKNANGLLVYHNTLFHGGESWSAFDIESKQQIESLTVMGKGLVDIDGITIDGQGGFIVSLINDNRLWSVGKGRTPRPLTEDDVNGIDMQFNPTDKRLFLPRVGNTLSVYRLSVR